MAVPVGTTTLAQAQVMQTFAATLTKRRTDMFDQVLHAHPVLDYIKGKIQSGTGLGVYIPVRVADLNLTTYTDGNGTHSLSIPGDIFIDLLYRWANDIVSPLTLQRREIEMNRGSDTQIINLVARYIEFVKVDHANFLAKALWDKTAWLASPTTCITPINVMIDNDPTIAVGGIKGADYPAWLSTQVNYDPSVTGFDMFFVFEEASDQVFLACGERPKDFIVGRNVWRDLKSAIAKHNYNVQERGETQEISYPEMTFQGTKIRLDGECPKNEAYGINPSYLEAWSLNNTVMELVRDNAMTPGVLNTTSVVLSNLQLAVTKRNAHVKIVRNALADPTYAGITVEAPYPPVKSPGFTEDTTLV